MGKRFDQMTEATSVDYHDLLLIEQDPATTKLSKKVTMQNFIGEVGPFVDLRAYLPAGFVTDGSVDYATQLQSWLTACSGKAGYIPPGIWSTTTGLTYNVVTLGRISIFGSGPSSVIRVKGATTKGLMITGAQGGGHDFVYLRDFRIESYTTGSSAALLHLYGVAAFGIHRLNLDGRVLSDIGILMNGSGTAGTQQGEISNCSIFSNLQGIVAENGGANGTEIHGCTIAANTVRDVYYNTNSSGASSFNFHDNHLVYGHTACVSVELGATASVRPSFRNNHFEGSYASVFKVLEGKLEARNNLIMGGGTGVTNAFDIQGGAYHDITGNFIISADVAITGGTPINYLYNTIFAGNGSTTCTNQTSFGNRHFGAGTDSIPQNYIIHDGQTPGNMFTIRAPAVSGAWGFRVMGAGTNQDVYIQLGTASLKGTSGADTHLRTSGDLWPDTDNSYYLGKNDDDTPAAWKGLIVKDTANGKYYRIQVTNGAVNVADLTD